MEIDVVALTQKGNIGGEHGFTKIDVDPIVEIDVVALILCGKISGGTLGPQVGTIFALVASSCESHV